MASLVIQDILEKGLPGILGILVSQGIRAIVRRVVTVDIRASAAIRDILDILGHLVILVILAPVVIPVILVFLVIAAIAVILVFPAILVIAVYRVIQVIRDIAV